MISSEQKGNLIINGSGSSSGGTYEEVKINGHGRIDGHVECRHYHSNGSSKLIGDLRAELCKVNGSSTIEGNVDVDKLEVSGMLKLVGSFRGGEIRCDGQSKIRGSVTSDAIVIRGDMTVEENLEAETFDSKGTFKVSGLLNAGKIEVTLHGSSEAREIGGESIQVKRSVVSNTIGRIVKGLFGFNDVLTADVIEGDEITLEATRARIVRGNRVNVGPDCEIGLIEYKTELHKDRNSTVNEERRL